LQVNEKNGLSFSDHLHLIEIQKSNKMKATKLLTILVTILLLSGCVVFSFYPIYTEDDLFPNDILTGVWTDGEGANWTFEHPYNGEKIPENLDKKRYQLIAIDEEEKESEYTVHIIELDGHYIVDFFLEDFDGYDELGLAMFHIVPVHTFAKLSIVDDTIKFNWFDPEWLEDLIDKNKIRIHHEDNGEYILLTANPKELQKFVIKYVEEEAAFEDGVDVELIRKK
jgi:hypothetical protein